VVGKEQLKKLKEEHVEKKHLGYVIDFLNFIFRCTL